MEQTSDAFAVELRRRREERGLSQAGLAAGMGYDRSYVSKIEAGAGRATPAFAARAEAVLQAGGALVAALPAAGRGSAPPWQTVGAPAGVVVLHDGAELTYDGGCYAARHRCTLVNGGAEPVTRYPVRIAVDGAGGFARLRHEHSLAPADLGLRAELAGAGGREPLSWRVEHDGSGAAEVWLLLENERGRFPLYPGGSTTIEYAYRVGDTGRVHWFERTVRFPTRALSVALDLPAALGPVVWGTETTMTAGAMPLRTPVDATGTATRRRFLWSVSDPPLHARYRFGWAFGVRDDPGQGDGVAPPGAAGVLRGLGVVQHDDPRLLRPVRPFDLPRERAGARLLLVRLQETLDRVAALHDPGGGVGLSAPQLGTDRAAALVRTPGARVVALLNPRVVDASRETREQYEGCLSFVGVRGLTPRPLRLDVEHQALDGTLLITSFEQGPARLVAHAVDHLEGRLFTGRMRVGLLTVPVSQHGGGGRGC